MSERIKLHFRSELETLKLMVQIPPRQTMLLHVAVYKILHEMTDHTEEVMEGMPKEFGGKPMVELLLKNYYEKYEQQRLEKEAEAAAQMEEDPEAAEAEVSTNPYVKSFLFLFLFPVFLCYCRSQNGTHCKNTTSVTTKCDHNRKA